MLISQSPQTVAFKTIGCRLNQAETALIRAQFIAAGYSVVPFGDTSDVCVIHTCTVTENAQKTCIRLARSVKQNNQDCKVVLAGCAVEVDRDTLSELSNADILVAQSSKFNILDLLGNKQIEQADHNPVPAFETTRALVRVQNGCEFRCTYCIVPDTRGTPASRPISEVINEIQSLADNGYREIVLTGANIGCYKDGNATLVDILAAAEAVQQISRIRLSSIELSTIERVVIDFMSGSTKLCHHIHIPMQSGDDRVLSTMRRHYSSRQYRDFIEYAADRIPFLGFGTDVIVGFPGETQQAFDNTKRMIQELPFSNLHVFPYSRRPGTPAADMPCQIPDEEKKRRSTELIALGQAKRIAFAQQFIGREVSALIEKMLDDGAAAGWTSEYLRLRICDAEISPNTVCQATPDHLDGDILIASSHQC